MRQLALGLIGAALLAVPAHATIVYASDFDSDNGGVTALDYPLAGFTAADGTIDLVHSGDGFGIVCAGGAGGCLDLDGSTRRAGSLLSTARYAFAAGDTVTLRYAVSGSQRAGYGTDGYSIGFDFDQATGLDALASGLAGTALVGGDALHLGIEESGIAYDRGFAEVMLAFTPTNSGSFRLYLGGRSSGTGDSNDDNVGVIMDNLSVDVSTVPEPATWLTMLAGFAAIGFGLRRHGPHAVSFG